MKFEETKNLPNGTRVIVGAVRMFDGVPQHHFSEGDVVTIVDRCGIVNDDGEELNVYFCQGNYPDGEPGMTQMLDNNDLAAIYATQ